MGETGLGRRTKPSYASLPSPSFYLCTHTLIRSHHSSATALHLLFASFSAFFTLVYLGWSKMCTPPSNCRSQRDGGLFWFHTFCVVCTLFCLGST